MPKVLNLHWITSDEAVGGVYIGRPSKWGNPFKIGPDGDRAEVIRKFEAYVSTSPLRDNLWELRGKSLICYCAPEACHGDVLLRLANAES